MLNKVLLVKARFDGPSAVCEFGGKSYECIVGKHGVVAAADKREGDNRTPLGRVALVDGYYRPDRVQAAGICTIPLDDSMGWCDVTDDELYNRECPADYKAGHELLWLEGMAYDYIGVMDYNLLGEVAPDGKGRGSAIFLHVWGEVDYTAGCVALKKADLEEILRGGVDVVEVVLEG